MKLSLSSTAPRSVAAEALLLPVFEEDGEAPAEDWSLAIRQAFRLPEFSGKTDEQVVFYEPDGLKSARLMLLGMGPRDRAVPETIRSVVGGAVKRCLRMKLTDAAMVLPRGVFCGMTPETVAAAAMEGALLANHRFDRFRSERGHEGLKAFRLLTGAAGKRRLESLPRRAAILCEAVIMAREWVTTPPNRKKPAALADVIRRAAVDAGVKANVLNEKALKRQKCEALLAVNAGSDGEARMLVLEYAATGARNRIVLVGKGVTFDSGGINLKSSNAIETMKIDMAGAAAVSAALIAAARLKLPVDLVGVIPLVENMVSGAAVHPGDIITGYAGKSIEILNTDAEGRLILSDALAYAADRFQPNLMIDLATLTGACVMALGESIAGVFSRDDALAEAILSAGAETHERCWRLPLPEDYKESIKSDVADIRNLAKTREGGAITAALFLSEFTGDIPWAHIDIAGPAYARKSSAYCEAGGTGFGVRLLCRLLETIAAGQPAL